MKYWYGYRAIELDGSNPGKRVLSEAFNTYSEAKKNKLSRRKDHGIEWTGIFQAENKEDANKNMENESFSRL